MSVCKHGNLCATPPHMLRQIVQNGNTSQRERAEKTLDSSEQFRGKRVALAEGPFTHAASGAGLHRSVYNANNGSSLPGSMARDEGAAATGDNAVDEAYDGSGETYRLLKDEYGRDSLDGNGMKLKSTTHYQTGYDNAFWNGSQMVYGDGDEDLPEDERFFNRFTISLDIIGHELAHGLTQFTAGLRYVDQSGALNESMSDVFGSLVKQRKLNQTAADADWLIGAELLTSNVNGSAIRSMKAPGTAYDDPVIGKDPQPGHMRDYKDVDYDNGGVHINSGIPNHAFYLIALELGGNAWEKAGKIWFQTLTDSSKMNRRSQFTDAAKATWEVAGSLFGTGSLEQQAVKKGWNGVGLEVDGNDNGGGGGGGGNTGCLVAPLVLTRMFT